MTYEDIEVRSALPGHITLVADFHAKGFYTIGGTTIRPGDLVVIDERFRVVEKHTGQERAAISVGRWLAGSAPSESDDRPDGREKPE